MKKTLFIMSAALLLNSCLVTKKRYDTAVMNGKKSLDSLNKVFNKTVEGFNASTNTLKINNTDKDISLDSLNREVKKLSGDKAALNQSLLNTINDYKEEKQKLSQKTRIADSLMNILSLQSATQDSLRNLNDGQKRELDALLATLNRQFSGINQSEAFAQIIGAGVTVTFSNDFLFKAGTAEISVKGAALLKKIAAVLTVTENCRVQVISNTDNTGQAKTLLDLSARRASAVISDIAANSTLPGTAYTASGRGMYSPLVANDNAGNKKKNRRTDLIIIKN